MTSPLGEKQNPKYRKGSSFLKPEPTAMEETKEAEEKILTYSNEWSFAAIFSGSH